MSPKTNPRRAPPNRRFVYLGSESVALAPQFRRRYDIFRLRCNKRAAHRFSVSPMPCVPCVSGLRHREYACRRVLHRKQNQCAVYLSLTCGVHLSITVFDNSGRGSEGGQCIGASSVLPCVPCSPPARHSSRRHVSCWSAPCRSRSRPSGASRSPLRMTSGSRASAPIGASSTPSCRPASAPRRADWSIPAPASTCRRSAPAPIAAASSGCAARRAARRAPAARRTTFASSPPPRKVSPSSSRPAAIPRPAISTPMASVTSFSARASAAPAKIRSAMAMSPRATWWVWSSGSAASAGAWRWRRPRSCAYPCHRGAG